MSISYQELSQKKAVYYWLYGFGAVLLIITGFLWWTKVSVDPQRVFESMLSNSLKTSGVATKVHQESQGTTIDQTIQFAAGSTNQAQAITVIKQGTTQVKTELRGNATDTYTRYASIAAGTQNNAKLKGIVGVWAKSDGSGDAVTPLLSQAVLGVGLPVGAVPIPIAQVSNDDRASLLRQIRENGLYQVKYDSVKRTHKAGKLLYTYQVTIQPIVYLNVMKNFAKAVNMRDLDTVDANSYSGAEPVILAITVDAHARQLTQVKTASGYAQDYTSYGVIPSVVMPTKTITSSELTKRLSALQ